MTDLEMTKLCAEAIDLRLHKDGTIPFQKIDSKRVVYDPLNNDAQAMALVKKFRLHLNPIEFVARTWTVYSGNAAESGFTGQNNDLNRAIVECIAKMQSSKCKQSNA